MIVVTFWSHISCSLLVLSLSSVKRGPDIGEMWELEACVFCKGTCGEAILDNRPVWVAGVCVSPVACLAARLLQGWLNLLWLAGLNQVCWVVVRSVGPFLVDQMTSCSFWFFLVGLVHLTLRDCILPRRHHTTVPVLCLHSLLLSIRNT